MPAPREVVPCFPVRRSSGSVERPEPGAVPDALPHGPFTVPRVTNVARRSRFDDHEHDAGLRPVAALLEPTLHRIAVRSVSPEVSVRSPITLQERFCDDHNVSHDEFAAAALRLCLRPPGRLLFWLWPRNRFFDAEWELIGAAAPAVSMREVRHAIDDYWSHPANRSRLRRMAHVRISTQRLRRLAYGYLGFDSPDCAPGRGRRPG